MIPDKWCWARLNTVAINHDSLRKPVNSEERKKRKSGKITSEVFPYYGATGQVDIIDKYLLDGVFVLLGEDAAPFLDKKAPKAYIVNGKVWVNNHAHILQSMILSEYLLHCLNATDYLNYVYGTTRLKLTQENMNRILIPVAPLNEQNKIVDMIQSISNSISHITELVR